MTNRILAAARTDTLDIVENASAAGLFSKMLRALEAADLTRTFKEAGPFTVFAPTDEAISKLPEGAFETLLTDRNRLIQVIKFHILPSKVPSSGNLSYRSKTMQGNMLRVVTGDGRITVENAHVTTGNIACRNGVLFGIDMVLTPSPDLLDQPAARAA